MTRTIPLLLLAFAAACSDPDLMGPEAVPIGEPVQTVVVGDPILDAIERITPSLADRVFAGELTAALKNAEADPVAVERLLETLAANEEYAADAEAIRLALVRR
jgi:hypothetical protein